MKKIIFLSAVVAFNVVASENSVVGMAKESGIKTCIPQIEKVSNFIIAEKKHGSHAAWNINDSDKRMYSSLTSKGYSDGDSHVSIVSSLNSSGKCDTYYTETFAFAKSCMLVREETYNGLEFSGTLNEKTIVLKNDGGANYYLTNQGSDNSMCLVTKRETVYQ